MNVSRRVTSTVAKSVAGRVTDTGGYSVPPTPSAPSFTSDPEITGNTWVGELLTVSNGTATGYPSAVITYQWKRDTVSISGATSNTYTLQVADDTTDITCTVTRTNSEGSDSATSAAVGPIKTKPANTVAPAITGSTSVDSELTCSTGTWTGTATITYSYQWYAD
ncbi:hypothetical protein KC887_06400, partial [Candidatus Kaiserbacteria bacterium]|nr:hypothetical protein [Candidatus Kaiserbacteria bacterium]